MNYRDNKIIKYEIVRKNNEDKVVTAPRCLNDSIKAKINRLMENPDKPIIIPAKKTESKLPRAFNPPEFVHNIWGSSAGAGSGEFDVYRNIRRREYARQKYRKIHDLQEKLDNEYHEKVDDNKKLAQEKTAKKRAKRQKQKQHGKSKKKCGQDSSADSSDSDSSDDSEAEKLRQEYRDEIKKSEEVKVDVQGQTVQVGDNEVKVDEEEEKKEPEQDVVEVEQNPAEETADKVTDVPEKPVELDTKDDDMKSSDDAITT